MSVPDTWVTDYSEDIGNTFGPKGFEPAGLVVEVSEIIVHEVDGPNAVIGLFDSEVWLAGEHLAEIDLLPIEADAAAGRDGGNPVMDVRKTLIGPSRWANG